jgi:hypothetical protein
MRHLPQVAMAVTQGWAKGTSHRLQKAINVLRSFISRYTTSTLTYLLRHRSAQSQRSLCLQLNSRRLMPHSYLQTTVLRVSDVEPVWTTLFAKALQDNNANAVLLNTGPGSTIRFRTRAAPQSDPKYLSAYLLPGLAGNTSPSAEDVKVRSGRIH